MGWAVGKGRAGEGMERGGRVDLELDCCSVCQVPEFSVRKTVALSLRYKGSRCDLAICSYVRARAVREYMPRCLRLEQQTAIEIVCRCGMGARTDCSGGA